MNNDDKQREWERLKAYQKLLDTMQNSLLVQNMPLKDRNLIKSQNMQAPLEVILNITKQIEDGEKAYRDEEEAKQRNLQKTTDNLQALTYEAEMLLKKKSVPNEGEAEEDVAAAQLDSQL